MDMNNNGLQDLIFTAGQGDNNYMLMSRGDGTFEKEVAFSGGGATDPGVRDLGLRPRDHRTLLER